MTAPRSGYGVNPNAYKRSGRPNLRYKTELVYGEWESRLEIRVAWIAPDLSIVPVQIT